MESLQSAVQQQLRLWQAQRKYQEWQILLLVELESCHKLHPRAKLSKDPIQLGLQAHWLSVDARVSMVRAYPQAGHVGADAYVLCLLLVVWAGSIYSPVRP